ncbi:MAG: imidazole glycerol phosphate synthase subunit HisH [bacterium]|nr:imidazole glycerol phosphate synthase subunit HisH [bacterium]
MKGAIVIVDYGMGNVKSVRNALARIGAACVLSTDPVALAGAPGIILPGVGGFPECMQALDASGLSDPLRDAIARGVPYLGICLGLQVLFEESEEFGKTPGLGILPGRIRRFPKNLEEAGEALHVPHMGWNGIHLEAPSPLLEGVAEGEYFYFVHSYYAEPGEACRPCIAATCTHGVPFIASVRRGNLFATQFHPEKSGARGLEILRRFASLCGLAAAPSPSA